MLLYTQIETKDTYRPHIPDVIILNRAFFSFSNFVGDPALWKSLKKRSIIYNNYRYQCDKYI